MTTLGKTLTVTIVLLSFCLMMFAGAVYQSAQNWRKEYTEANKQYNAEKKKSGDFQQELTRISAELETEKQEALNAANEAQASLSQLRDEFEDQEDQLTDARQERDVALRQAEIANQEAEFKRQETQSHRENIAKLEATITEQAEKNRALQDDIYNQKLEISEVTEKHARLLDQYVTLQEVLAHNNIDPNPEAHKGLTEPPPVVEGFVLETLDITGKGITLVQVSVGSDDGIAVGHSMYVYRGASEDGTPAQYLGEVKITRVTPDSAVGELILKSKNGIIARGDNVKTKL